MLMNYHMMQKVYSKDQRDEQNPPTRFFLFPRQLLSTFVDLRVWMTPVKHQENTNTCCPIAFTAICEYLIRRSNNRPYTVNNIDLSRLFLYYNGQRRNQQTYHVQDLGVDQRSVALGLRQFGVCEEEFWPYQTHLLNKPPSPAAYMQAKKYTVVLLRVPLNIECIEKCLHHQIPVPLDIIMDDDTARVIAANSGYLNMRQLNDQTIDRRDLHTVLIVGYDRARRHFIARNSWGSDWGSGGYFYLPYEFLSHRRRVHHGHHLWTVMKIIPRPAKLPSVRQLAATSHLDSLPGY